MKLRLGFHYHVPANISAGTLYMPGHMGKYLDSLAQYCQELVCFLHTPMPNELKLMDYTIESSNITFISLGPHNSMPRRLARSLSLKQILKDRASNLDAMLIRGPSPLLPLVAHAVGNLPVVLLLVGDYVAGLRDLHQPYWRMSLIRAWAIWNKAEQLQVARKSLTFVNSHKLYEELKPFVSSLVETHTTTLTQDDFFTREDTCLSPPYHLLYTGRMDRGKGLADMVEALALLVSGGEDVVLDLVGWPEKGDAILEQIQSIASEKGITDRLRYHGYQPLGSDLFEYYKNADIYVIASRSSEGFPRTIWEAMAHSLPVVATRVGSIPDYVEEAAFLVEPCRSDILARAIQMLLHTSQLRQRLIARGFDIARENTLEIQAKIFIDHIQKWLMLRPINN